MIKTIITVICEKDGLPVSEKIINLPSDNPEGFHGVVSLKLKAGRVVECSVPRETLVIREKGDEVR